MPASALRALIVDDNPTARIALAGMTTALGWTADVAASGDEAAALLRQRLSRGAPYEVVFVDWQMPGMDGWQTSARLREIAGPERLPLVLMVTANGREKLAERSVQEQALLSGYLVKPVTASMLREAVAEAQLGGAAAPAAPSSRRLAGMRLLVVEDNLNNQQVAQELLEGEGALVSIAVDGAQGVAAVAGAKVPFDAVLMDVQMPVMDGYTATSEIRRRLGLAALPIIAMTANAMSSDRDASLAAGMNAHVGKPFDLDELVATLLQHAGQGRPAAKLPAARCASDLPAELAQEGRLRGIELETAVARFGGRTDVWSRTARSFVGQIEGIAQDLNGMLDRGELADVGRLMHTLKGLAGMLGAADLARFAADAEGALRGSPTPARLAELRAAAGERIAQTGLALTGLLQRLRPTPPPVAPAAPAARDKQALLRELGALTSLLAQADMAATDSFAALQDAHEPEWADELHPLSEAVAALDFERALVECDLLTKRLVAA